MLITEFLVWNTTFSKILALKVNLIGKFDPISLSLVTFVICLLEKNRQNFQKINLNFLKKQKNVLKKKIINIIFDVF